MTTETQKMMMRSQRSGGRRVVAPDIRIQNSVREQAHAADKKELNAPRVVESTKIGIGTDAVYNTLPNSATVATLSQKFEVLVIMP